jgi:ubiquinone/menaquinone biosynthesis C-methylase UbiE
MSNKDTYESDDVVHLYGIANNLQKPEETLLNLLKNDLKHFIMLDVGVGGGRTTIYFAPLVKKYVGIDYSKKMIEVCKKRFPKKENISFSIGDVRSLKSYKNESFDFVLFSFNGIDYVHHNEREKAFLEINRVLKRGGFFVFSTHNLNSSHRLYTINNSGSLITILWEIIRVFGLIILNGFPNQFSSMNWAIINDGSYFFRLKTYFIAPAYQLLQLQKLGFEEIRLFSLKGTEIYSDDLEKEDDFWLYYFCRKK